MSLIHAYKTMDISKLTPILFDHERAQSLSSTRRSRVERKGLTTTCLRHVIGLGPATLTKLLSICVKDIAKPWDINTTTSEIRRNVNGSVTD